MANQRTRRAARSAVPGVVLASLVAWLGLSLGLGAGLPWLLDDGASPTAFAGTAALLLGLAALVTGSVLLVRRLPGWYRPGTNRAAVVVRHGAGSQRFDTAPQAVVLHRHGYGVLLVDARGHGGSDGRAMDLGWYGEADTAAAADFLAARPEVDPGRIAVLGLSMGGEEGLGAAGNDPRIRAVVAEGATGRTAADKAWLPQEYGAAGVLQQQLDRVTYALVDLVSGAAPPASLADSVRAAAPAPVLLIAAGQVPDEGLVAQRLKAAAPGNVTVWVADGAGHTGALTADLSQWQRRVLEFLDAALPAEATTRPVP